MPNVTMPNGDIVAFPDDMPKEQIKGLIQSKFPEVAVNKETTPSKGDGYLDRLQSSFQERKQKVKNLQTANKPFLAGSKAIGQGAGFVSDIVGEGLESGLRALPDVVENPIRSAGRKTVETLMPAIKPVVEGYGKLKTAMPDTMSVVEDVANVGMLLAPAKAPVPAKKRILGEMGENLYNKGVAQSKEFVDDLVLPKMTKAVETDRQVAGLVSQSMLGTRKYDLNNLEKVAAEEIKNISGVKSLNSLPKNEAIVRNEAVKRSQSLVNDLRKTNIPISKDEVLENIVKKAINNISSNPMITTASGTSETANKIITSFADVFDELNVQNVSDLMVARQKFDQIAKKYRGNVFNDGSDNAYRFAVKEIRDNINSLIEQKVPDVAVRDRLRKSHALFEAADNMADKVPDAARTAAERLVKTIEDRIPGKSELVKLLTVGGAVSAGAVLAPGAALTAGGIYLGGKAVGSATTKKMVGNLLKVTDMAISQVKDKAIIEQLRADRAALADYLEYMSEQSSVEKE